MSWHGPTPAIDSIDIVSAGRELLSLALMDARNHTLHLLSHFEDAMAAGLVVPTSDAFEPPAWIGGHVAWWAEYWIARNPQRGLGPACPADGVRLASIEPQADHWFAPLLSPRGSHGDALQPTYDLVRSYLLETLETTLKLLDKADETAPGLHFFRAALFHEDARGEQLVTMAQNLGIALPLHAPPAVAVREALLMPAVRWTLGTAGAAFSMGIERPAHEVDVPEFEIDAQPVCWAQFVEFVDDGGYDRQELWHPQGWSWLVALAQQEGRRGPRHVEQIGVASGTVMQTFFGRPTRLSGTQPTMHVSWWEADAWARWAGRRLPTEVEWEVAACLAARRGFRWGDVHEWTAGTLRPWPGYVQDAWTRGSLFDPSGLFGQARVVRGASFATCSRMKHPKRRGFALPGRDDAFVGFRTCAC